MPNWGELATDAQPKKKKVDWEALAAKQKKTVPPPPAPEVDDVGDWGRENPNAYAAKNAALETLNSVGTAATNIPSSAMQLGKDLWSAVSSPVETAKAVGDVALGGAQLLVPGEQGEEDKARAVGQFFADRYGGAENFKKTFEEDPVGVFGDLATFLTGAGAGVRGASMAGKISPITRTATGARAVGIADDLGRAALAAGDVVEPMSTATKVAGKMARPVQVAGEALASGLVGDVFTSSGQKAVQQAMAGSSDFSDAMRNKVTPQDTLTELKTAIGEVKDIRRNQYNARRAELKGNAETIDPTPIKTSLNKQLNEMGVTRVDNNGQLKIARTETDAAGRAKIQEVYDLVNSWGVDDLSELTPDGLYVLRRNITSGAAPTNNSRVVVEVVKGKIDELIKEKSPDYSDMMSGYAELSDTVKQVEKAFSLGDRASADTALNKISTATRKSGKNKALMIEEIDELTGRNISDKIAGANMADFMPSGLIGKGLVATMAYSGVNGTALGPKMVKLFMVASPRVIGETIHTLYGVPKKHAAKIVNSEKFKLWRRGANAAYQSGKIDRVQDKPLTSE